MDAQAVSTPANVPVMSKEKFSELVGLEPGVIQGWIEKGHIPTLKIGRHRLINIALLNNECLEQEL